MNEYTNYPDIAKRINKATGGPNARMPAFFCFTKNGRAATNGKKIRRYAKLNNSTMNRICAAFDDIGNINMNFAGVPPFNWQMLMSGPCSYINMDIVEEFVILSNLKQSIIISNSEDPMVDNDNKSRTALVEEKLRKIMIYKFGSLEYCYPSICKFLFCGENASKAAHKQTFWKIFGDIAVENLKNNLRNCKTCTACGAKYPDWEKHDCPKDQQGLPTCVDCKKLFSRTSSSQRRCPECQEHFRKEQKRLSRERTKQRRKERAEQYTSFLRSHSTKMW